MKRSLNNLRNKILDVSLRNPQINYKATKTSTVQFFAPKLSEIYDSLVKLEKSIDINPQNEKIISAEIEGIKYQYGKVTIDKNQLDVISVLNRLQNRTKLATEEMGIHPLFMTFGMLNWYDYLTKKHLSSPLIMVPVYIIKKSAKQFEIKYNKGDILLNPTLLYRLETDNIFISSYDLFDHDGFSISAFFKRIAGLAEIKSIKGNITEEVNIGLFSSSSLFMYRDLLDNEKFVLQNLNFQKLYGNFNPDLNINEPEFVDAKYIDKSFDLAKTNLVLESDSSQQIAILAAKDNMSFVLQGPPGTGKSQTITNIIADAISNDKKVLFVAEKKAALDVVYEKLKEANLADFVLDVHSHGAKKDLVINNLINSVKNKKDVDASKLAGILESLSVSKKNVEEYLDILNAKNDIIELSFYELYGEILKLNDFDLIRFNFNEIFQMTKANLKLVLNDFQILSDYLGEIDYDHVSKALHGFKSIVISNPEQLKSDFNKAVANIIKYEVSFESIISDFNNQFKFQLENNISSLFFINILTDKSMLEKYDCYFGLKKYDDVLKAIDEIMVIKSILPRTFKSTTPFESITDFEIDSALEDLNTKYNSRLSRIGRGYRVIKENIELVTGLKNLNHDDLIKNAKIIVKFLPKAQDLKNSSVVLKKIDNNFSSTNNLEELKIFIISLIEISKTQSNVKLQSLIKTITNANFNTVNAINLRANALIKQVGHDFDIFNTIFDESIFNFITTSMSEVVIRLKEASLSIDYLDELNNVDVKKTAITEAGYSALLSELELFDRKKWQGLIKKKYYQTWLDYLYFKEPFLSGLTKTSIERDLNTFIKNDYSYLNSTYLKIQNHLYEKLPLENNPVLKILENESIKKRGQKSIRQIFDEMMDLVLLIKPCLLMSPVSVSTFLPAKTDLFDLVIFDEASQIVPENAISSIYRGKQLIVVGDHEQLPPSSFFKQVIFEDENETEVEITNQYESILDISRAYLPSKKLRWHYRSRHESLIRFSNNEIYKDLIIFPEAFKTNDSLGVRFEYVSKGYFENRQNIIEARKIALLVIEHIKNYPKRSLGIVSFSVKQQETIESEVNKIRKSYPQYDDFFNESNYEPFFVKNLENVQGDERDTIILSVCYAKDLSGKLAYRFGPINQDVGYRRLNVATTRAKYNTIVVSSLLPEEIKKTEPRGVAFLKGYLDYAKNGSEIEQKILKGKELETALERDIYDFIKGLGYEIDLYVSPFIQLAIKNPETGKYVFGIQVDGFPKNLNYTLRDKFRNATSVLESKDWKIIHIWSFDWFRNNQKNKNNLERILLAEFKTHPPKNLEIIEKVESSQKIVIPVKESKAKTIKTFTKLRTIQIEIEEDVLVEEERIYPYYLETSKKMIPQNDNETNEEYLTRFVRKTIAFESPIHHDVLFSRIANLYGDKFLGRQMESDITKQLITWHISKEVFYSKNIVFDLETPVMFRIPLIRGNARKLNEITATEIAMGIQIYLDKHLSVYSEDIRNEISKQLVLEMDNKFSIIIDDAIKILINQEIIEVNSDVLYLKNK